MTRLFSRFHPRNHTSLLLLLLIVPLLISSFVADLGNLNDYHGDENGWIPISNRAFQLYVIDHDLSNPFWQDDWHSFGSYNPQIGKYIIGMGTYLAGYHSIPLIFYNWNHSLAWNIEHGTLQDSHIVRAGRLPVALLGVLSCVCLFWLAALVADQWLAYLAVCSLFGGRLLLNAARRAMLDVPGLCFGLLALVCMWYLLRAIRAGLQHRALVWALGVGVVCGLAIGSKMTAFLTPIICIAALLLEWIVCLFKRRNPFIAPLCGLLIVLVSAGIFVASNPFLIPDPIAGIQHMLDFARVVAEAPSASKTTTLVEKFEALWRYNLYYAPLNQIGLPGDRWLLLAGGVGMLVTAWRSPGAFWERSLGLISVWIVITYVGIWLWLPNAWDRYTLPVQPCSAFLQAFGAIWVVQVGRKLWRVYAQRKHIA